MSRFCCRYAPVAQLDRASDSDSEGRAFESHRAYHFAVFHMEYGVFFQTVFLYMSCIILKLKIWEMYLNGASHEEKGISEINQSQQSKYIDQWIKRGYMPGVVLTPDGDAEIPEDMPDHTKVMAKQKKFQNLQKK